jgi:acyl-CoA reductase-like NAD-dependent aldehyde dehydrogenase
MGTIVEKQLYIGGKWVDGHSGSFIEVENPATLEIIGKVPEGDREDVHAAVAAADAALPSWKAKSPEERSDLLLKVAEYIEAHAREIAQTITAELGAPVSMVEDWHVASPIGEAKYFAKVAREFSYETKYDNLIVRREPVGVVAGLTPWNYPLDQISVKLLPALVAGNTVVLKPSQHAPLSAYWFAYALESAGFPPGVFNLVTGRGGVVGNILASHPDVQMISFTGSTAAGIEVGRLALGTVKKLALEMGGKSASVVLPGADLELAATKTATKCFINTGQTCSALTRLLVPRADKKAIEKLLCEKAAAFRVGDPLDPGVDIGPLVSRKQFDKVKHYLQVGLDEGAKMICGSLPGSGEDGYYVEPVIFTDVDNSMRIAQEEIFGPVLCVIYYDTLEEAEEIANDSPYGLSGAAFGPPDEAKAFAERMQTGVVHINGAAFTLDTPFGGYKQSGLGRENGPYGFEEYMEVKALPMDLS